MMSTAPRNRTTGAERLSKAKQEGAQGQRRGPKLAAGKKARWDWFGCLYQARDLSATMRHVGMVLALFGDADGSRIRPGIRELASRCNLSARAVSKSLSGLVCRGYLLRKFRAGHAGTGAGFEYLLSIPTVLTDDQHLVCTRTTPRCAPSVHRPLHYQSIYLGPAHRRPRRASSRRLARPAERRGRSSCPWSHSKSGCERPRCSSTRIRTRTMKPSSGWRAVFSRMTSERRGSLEGGQLISEFGCCAGPSRRDSGFPRTLGATFASQFWKYPRRLSRIYSLFARKISSRDWSTRNCRRPVTPLQKWHATTRLSGESSPPQLLGRTWSSVSCIHESNARPSNPQ